LLFPEQRIDELSLGKIKDFSKKLTAINGYTILSFQDVSHAGAKRYSANVLLSKEYSKPDIEKISREITTELKARDYHRNNLVKQHWQGREAQVVWLFLYLTLDDVSSVNWICRTQWISKDLPSEFLPTRLDGECIDDGIVIDWNKNYIELETFFGVHRVTKENYLDSMNDILSATRIAVNQAIELTTKFSQDQDDDKYVIYMSKIEPKVEQLYFKATHIGSAPTECNDLSQRFQCLMVMAHNIVLPFSEQGLKTWERTNRTYLVDQAIKGYQKDLLRLEFEFEKIH